MTDEYILGIDFGSEYIRVSTSQINRAFLPYPIPQVVEFGGDRSLRNILMLTPEMDDFEEIGIWTKLEFHQNDFLLERTSI